MAISQAVCNSFKKELLEGKHDFANGGDTFKIALFTSSASLGATTTAYSTSNEITNTSGSAYVAGGQALTGQSVTGSGSATTAFVDFSNNPQWTSASYEDIVLAKLLLFIIKLRHLVTQSNVFLDPS